ncbi:hypothetical protein ACFVHB_34240 [Kitasatospora sp. NPDC127111]|uniref:hypothetical protein n=1 Tax=Kitasatospora sp. NPDC127111 TaxID=3345363 RepID=UPI0036357ABC
MTWEGRRIPGWAAGAAAAVTLVTGCSSLTSREDAAAAAAQRFEAAVQQQDNSALCRALAPGTRQELEDNVKSSCEQAIGDSDLPPASGISRVDVYGQQARVVLDQDTLFLSAFPEGWKITAAGCRPEPRKPYRCELKGS